MFSKAGDLQWEPSATREVSVKHSRRGAGAGREAAHVGVCGAPDLLERRIYRDKIFDNSKIKIGNLSQSST